MEIYSRKIDTDILHVIEAPDGAVLFEGWDTAGIDEMLRRLAGEDTPHEYVPVEAITDFYRKIEIDMPEVDEMRVALGKTDIHNIRLCYEDGSVEHHPNRFCFYES